MISATDLRVDDWPEPLGLDNPAPAFSWIPLSTERAQYQTALRILVASSPDLLEPGKADMWDSGRLESAETLYYAYAGRPLESAQQYYWAVQLWDKAGAQSAWSAPARFSTGLFSSSDWEAVWIGRGPAKEPHVVFDDVYARGAEAVERRYGPIPVDENSVLLRTEFSAAKPVRRAIAFVSGLGFYHMYINGRRAGSHAHSPSKTDYRKQVFYDAVEVTEFITQGKNAIGLILGNGWYNPSKKYWGWSMQWHGSKRAILQLHLTYEDGSCDVVTTNERWKTSSGPVLTHCLYDGENFDARLEQPGWDTPQFNDSEWTNANRVEPPGGRLRSHDIEPVAIVQTIRPEAVWEASPGVYIYDMGQNFSGVARIRIQAPQGTRIQLRYAENVDAAGQLEPSSNMLALNTDVFICEGKGLEVYEPYFTYHGFQYVEVSGWPGVPTLDSLDGRVMQTAFAATGELRCSNDLVNRIHHCSVWSQRSNMMGLPTDDNQRNERLGWMADGHLTVEQCLCNFDSVRVYRKWLRDMKEAQRPDGAIDYVVPRAGFDTDATDKSPLWSSAYPLICWELYEHTGDARVIEEHFDGVRAFVDFLSTRAADGILPPDRYGDHVSIADGFRRSDPPLATTAYYYADVLIVSRMAGILGKGAIARQYQGIAEAVREAFNQRYFDAARNEYGSRTQTEMILPLWAGLVAEDSVQAVFDRLVAKVMHEKQGHLHVGIIGAKHALDVFMHADRPDIAWNIINSEDYPGWGSLVRNRTTLSENWDQSDSNNHVMWSHVDTWFYRELGGIRRDPASPGFKRIIFQPFIPCGVDWARAAMRTPRGRAACGWSVSGRILHLDLTVPPDTRAELRLPQEGLAENLILEMPGDHPVWNSGFQRGAHGVQSASEARGQVLLQLASGIYQFTCKWTGWPVPVRMQ